MNIVGETAMHVAARTGEVNVVKSIVKAGGKVRSLRLLAFCWTSCRAWQWLCSRQRDRGALTGQGGSKQRLDPPA